MAEALSPEAVRALVDNHARFLAFLAPRVGGREAAEEVLQAAFVKGLERGGALRDDEHAVAWFFRLLRNAVADHWRRRGAEARALEREAGEPEATAELETALDGVICECVRALVPTLKPEYAEALRRVDLGGESVDQLARALGITPNNAGVRLHRARQALRKQLERSCGTCTEHGCLACTCGGVRAGGVDRQQGREGRRDP